MAILKPNNLDLRVIKEHSYGEGEIIDKIKALDSEKTKDWVIFYSYDFKPNSFYYDSRKQNYEIDFLFLLPDIGIFIMEVKGGKISVNDGNYISRNSKGKSISIDPIGQAKDNFFYFRDLLRNKYKTNIQSYISDYCVSFPDMNYTEKLNSDALENEMLFKDTNLYDYFIEYSINLRKKYNNRIVPDKNVIDSIVNIINGPDFEYSVSDKQQIYDVNEIIKKQINAKVETYNSILYDNPRCVIDGVAGSGKTAFAIDLYHYFSKKNETTLFLVFNNLLSKRINETLGEGSCYTIYDFISKLYTEYTKQELDDKLEFERKKKIWFEFIRNTEIKPMYDHIIIDEAQDIRSEEELIRLVGSVLYGGMKDGSWYMFYDNGQRIFVTQDESTIVDTIDYPVVRPVYINLTESIRYNEEMKEIVESAYNDYLTDKTIDFKTLLKNSECAKYIQCNSSNEVYEKVVQIINDLETKQEIKDRQITILRDRRNSSSIELLDKKYGSNLSHLFPSQHALTTETVKSFKGLDNDVIIYIHDGSYRNSFDEYVALSRAKHKFFILDYDEESNELQNKERVTDYKFNSKNKELSDRTLNCDRRKSLSETICEYNIDSKIRRNIIDKGRKIYFENKIQPIDINQKNINAIVLGTKEYHTSIYREQTKLCFKCDCEYFMNDNKEPCKHLVSLMIKIKEENK